MQGKNIVHQGTPVDLNEVLSEAADRSRMPAESKSIEIRLGGSLPRRVHGDGDQLMMAFRNLIDNAVRYSPENTRVGIGLSSRDGIAQVTITDQGIGIAQEDQERIFERFYRVDAARSRQTGGTGLGLSIVKHVISNHGGEVSLWSQQGRGSTFTVRLPELDESMDSLDLPGSPRAEQEAQSSARAAQQHAASHPSHRTPAPDSSGSDSAGGTE